MNLRNLILIGCLMMMTFILMGCPQGEGGPVPEEQKLEGKSVPEYTVLLDPAKISESVSQDMAGLSGEQSEQFDQAMDAMGFLGFEKVSVEATEKAGNIDIRSVVKFTGADDTLMGYLNKMEPVPPKVIKGLSRDNLMCLWGGGNVDNALLALFSWMGESESFSKMVKDMSGMGGETSSEEDTSDPSAMIRMFLDGYKNAFSTYIFPYIGSEVAVACYYNPDFAGWEKSDTVDDYLHGSPVRVLAAFTLEKEGIAATVNDIAAGFQMANPMAAMMGEMEPPKLDIQTTDADGYKVYSYAIDETISIGWAEYSGVLFVGDVDMVKNLKTYYDPKGSAKTPDKYCNYFYVDVDGAVKHFYEPFKEEIKTAVDEEMTVEGKEPEGETAEGETAEGKPAEGDKDAADPDKAKKMEELKGVIKDILKAFDEKKQFGVMEIYTYNSKDGWVGTMSMSSVAGPFVLAIFNKMDEFTALMSGKMQDELGMGMPGSGFAPGSPGEM